MDRDRIRTRGDELIAWIAAPSLRALRVWILCVLGVTIAIETHARSVDLVYVEANVGNSSGGHMAVRFEERVYHFQNRGGRWLRMERVDWGWFRYAYGVVQNRDLVLHQIEVDDESFRALRNRFNDRYLVERKHFSTFAALRRDVELLSRIESAAAASTPAETGPLGLRGAGFFCRGASESPPALARLRRRVAARNGSHFVGERHEAVLRAMRGLPLAASEIDVTKIRVDRDPGIASTLSEVFLDLAQQHLALDALERPVRLCPGARQTLPGDDGLLGESERRSLEALVADLEKRLVALVSSSRPDWGDPLLLGMARLVALEATLQSGRWVLLDAFPHDARIRPGRSLRGNGRRPFLQELEADAVERAVGARRALGSAPRFDERQLSDWEDAANRILELRRGMGGRDVRVRGERLVPEGWKRVDGLPLPHGDGAGLTTTLLSEAKEAERRYEEALGRIYAYDLLDRNCVTEILRTLDATNRDASATRLAGRVDPEGPLHFIPAVAFAAVPKHFARVSTTRVASYRNRRLAEMRNHEARFVVFLRESNTLSSTLYRRNPRDSLFLFFTDDAWWARPIFGAFNLATGLGEWGWGVLALPRDSGSRLVSGTMGVAFSVPELFFLNFRKGTLEYGRRASETNSP